MKDFFLICPVFQRTVRFYSKHKSVKFTVRYLLCCITKCTYFDVKMFLNVHVSRKAIYSMIFFSSRKGKSNNRTVENQPRNTKSSSSRTFSVVCQPTSDTSIMAWVSHFSEQIIEFIFIPFHMYNSYVVKKSGD